MTSTRHILLVVGCAVAACGPDDEDVPVEPTFQALDDRVFFPRCTAPCHSGGPDVAAGGLDLEANARKAMFEVDAESRDCGGLGLVLIVPGDPEASLLYQKVVAKAEGVDPPCGDAMPSGPSRRALRAQEIEAIAEWILGGAAP